MAFCPADCQDITITPNDTVCAPRERRRNVSRIGFYTCDTEIPTPITQIGLEAFVEAGKLAFSSELANFTQQAPEYLDIEIGDCRTALRVIGNRVIDFQDRWAIDLPPVGSPADLPVPFYNQLFWDDKVNKQVALRYMFVYCDGSVEIPKDANGVPLSATLTAYRQQENQGSGQSKYFIEYIVGQLNFIQDPFALFIRPEMDAQNVVIDISSWGLF